MSLHGRTHGPRPRAECPTCGAEVALIRGTLRRHPDHRHELYGVPGAVRDRKVQVPDCPDSGRWIDYGDRIAPVAR